MRNRIFFFLSLTLAITLVITLSSSSTWAFDVVGCKDTSTILLRNCIEKSTSYGWNKNPEKADFVFACQTDARTIFQLCTRETSCPAFQGFLNNPDSACGSIQVAPKKDGCYEMFRQWKEAKLPFCPTVGLF